MQDKEILINNWLLKADEALEDARLNVNNVIKQLLAY